MIYQDRRSQYQPVFQELAHHVSLFAIGGAAAAVVRLEKVFGGVWWMGTARGEGDVGM